MTDFDSVGKNYTAFLAGDPVKQHLQYPLAIHLLTNLPGPVLDIGCGDGYFTRQIAVAGRKVVAFDVSNEQISRALAAESEEPLGIEYSASSAANFSASTVCGSAVAVMVLMYGRDTPELATFFRAAFQNTAASAHFVGVIFNPDFKRLAQRVYNRRWSLIDNGQLEVLFFREDEAGPFLTAHYPHHSRGDYEAAAKSSGYRSMEWIPPLPPPQEEHSRDPEFWRDTDIDPPYIGFIAKK